MSVFNVSYIVPELLGYVFLWRPNINPPTAGGGGAVSAHVGCSSIAENGAAKHGMPVRVLQSIADIVLKL